MIFVRMFDRKNIRLDLNLSDYIEIEIEDISTRL